MMRVGLTGGIGSGKTYVCRVFEHLGIPVYYADIEARRLMESNADIVSSIQNAFGEIAYVEGKLNRAYIASKVFSSKEDLNLLNSIVHPILHDDFLHWSELQDNSVPYVIEEAAILFESGGDKNTSFVIFVESEENNRVDRVVKRDSVCREDVMNRMKSQMPEEEKKHRSDFVIYNKIDSMVLPQIVDLHNLLLKKIG